MGLNTQFPEWMQRATDSNRAAGAALGQNILQGLRFQQGVKQQNLENRNLAEIQDAQLLVAQSQATIQRLNAQQQALASDDAVQAHGAMTGALALSTELSQSPNGYNPSNRARLYSYVSQNPFLAKTPWFKAEEEKFSLAEEYQRKAELLDQEITGKAFVNQQTLAAKEGMSYTDYIDSGMSPEEARQAVMSNKSGAFKLNQANTFLPMMVESYKANGIDVSPVEVDSIKAKFALGGVNAMNAPAKVVDQIQNADATSQQLQSIAGQVAAFNQKFGPNAFQEYVGPMDQPVFRFKTKKALGPDQLSAADREARGIQQQVFSIVQDYRNKNFGSALTANEESIFRNIVSNPADQDYVASLANFGNTLKNKAEIQVKQNKFAQNIPDDLKFRYLKKSEPVSAPAQKSGLTIESIEILP